jgi:hypothetical protein
MQLCFNLCVVQGARPLICSCVASRPNICVCRPTCGVVWYLRHKHDIIWRCVARNSGVVGHEGEQLTLQRIVTWQHSARQASAKHNSKIRQQYPAFSNALSFYVCKYSSNVLKKSSIVSRYSRSMRFECKDITHSNVLFNSSADLQEVLHVHTPPSCQLRLSCSCKLDCKWGPGGSQLAPTAAPCTCACGTTTSSGRSPHLSSGMPTTAASSTCDKGQEAAAVLSQHTCR